MQSAKIDNWQVVGRGSENGGSGGVSLFFLRGIVYDHPVIPDGHEIRTSTLQDLDFRTGTAKTQNTIYTLGDPKPTPKGMLG